MTQTEEASSGILGWFTKPRQREDKSLYLARSSHFPDANLHGFAIELENRPGSLLLVVQQISADYLNIAAMEGSGNPKERSWSLFVAVDFTGMQKSPRELMEKIKKLSTVISVEQIEPIVPGYLVDTAHLPLRLQEGMRFFIMSEVIVQSFFQAGYEMMGKDSTKLSLYHTGLVMGANVASMIREKLNVAGEDAIRVLLARGKAFGWWEGRGEANLQSNMLTIRLWQSLEGEYTKKWGTGCHLIRGFWDGALTEITGRRVQTVESSCISKNNEYCEFRLHPGAEVKLER